MKKLIAIPKFDKNGILDGLDVIECIYPPCEVALDGKQMNPQAFCPHLKTHQTSPSSLRADASQILRKF